MSNLDNCEVVYNVYQTSQYDLFTFINSNRTPNKSHVEKLKLQILEGYEMPPIIVRENGDILDGQHRYLALLELEKPIQFMIKTHIKKDVLQKSNSLVSKWSIMDHINYYRIENNEDYQQLYDFIEYSGLGASNAAKLLGSAKNKNRTTSMSKVIENGDFYVTNKEDAYQFVDEVLIRLRMEKPTNKIFNALRAIYNLGINNKLLVNVVNALEDEIVLINHTNKILKKIVDTYNKQADKVDRIKITYNKAGNVMLSI
ncbi:ParB N-terminal domain-containing protein [Staphylococcus hyicus]|uniref:ParB N-terminal domain-containing protein n=1 Tax=Staphylococcus hyicus TaxID=1284 RepID=UPI002365EB5C|nr:ParB N-terminal domain-containing protein [Staphylococcus hyicus]